MYYNLFYLFFFLVKPLTDVKFSTRCWFLTLYCHHVALIPAFTKHTRRYRTVRDLQKLVSIINYYFYLMLIIK